MKLQGFSLIEIMLAGAVFAVFALGIIEVLLFGLEADRLGEETTIATEYASAGMEAVYSIKAKNFDDLVITSETGIANDNGNWALSGSDNEFGKYTRSIRIAEVNRDGDGNIEEDGGTADADTKKITVTVSWWKTPTQSDSVILETYVTRWKS